MMDALNLHHAHDIGGSLTEWRGSRALARFLGGLLAAGLMATVQTWAAGVGPSGYTNNFATQPTAADWATLSISGGGTDSYDIDSEVNTTMSAGGVVTVTLLDGGNPPGAGGLATWSSSGFYLQTRPTGNRLTALMGKFVNQTGTNATQVTLGYLNTIVSASTTEDLGKGTRVYYSLTGLANSWANVPALNTTASGNESSTRTASLALNWPNGGNLFLLWVDDNAGAGTDSSCQMDNFSLRVTAGTPTNFFGIVTTPTHNAAVVAGASIEVSALAGNGTPPYNVEYFTNSGAGNSVFASAGATATPPYILALGSLPLGTHNIYAVVTDSTGAPLSTYSATNTFTVVNPIAFALTGPLDGSAFDHTTPVTGAASVSEGTPPYSVQFYLDDAPAGPAVISPPYQRNFGALFVGAHTVRATVIDAKGWLSNSLVSGIQITGPLATILRPTNGSSLAYGTSLSLTATVAGGTAPYATTFFVNGQPGASFNAPPFRTNLGVLPAGSYTCYVHATDSSVPAQNVYSTTNVIKILPAPLRIMPVGDSITLGLFVPGGFRAPLYQLLTNAGHQVDYLGTQTGNTSPSLPDNAHEGYSGWRISQIDGVILGVFAAVPDPDIILLMIGVNDYRASDDTANATNRLEALIVKMAVARPNAKIIVASLTALNEPFNTQIQMTFNPFLPGLCERQRALGRQVYFTDMHGAVPITDMPDQLHPNQLGYNKMATNWFTAIQLLPCTNCPPQFTLQPTNQLVLPGANVTLSAGAVGTGPVRYQWRFEGTNILNATNASYSFTNVSLTNGHGNFSVIVSDNVGVAFSTNAFVFVRISPGIVTPPVSQTVLQGQSATFTCVATGAPPLFYRWIRQGSAVFTNTTGIGVFTNVQASLTNAIRCNVMNAAGSATSANVSLFMVPDSDGDGMPDAWEGQYGFNATNVADALLDQDDDGMSNRDEYRAGTNPTNALSLLKVLLSTTNSGILEFVAQSNLAYTIQYRTNLTVAPWSKLTNVSAQSQVHTARVNAPFPPPTREHYFRVVTPPVP